MSKHPTVHEDYVEELKLHSEDELHDSLLLLDERRRRTSKSGPSLLRRRFTAVVIVLAVILVFTFAIVLGTYSLSIFRRIFGRLLSWKRPFPIASSVERLDSGDLAGPFREVLGVYVPNVKDSEAVDAQTVCPGYVASKVVSNKDGFTAVLSLAGSPCNVYGTDVDVLNLTVQYQSKDRLSIEIVPAYLDALNASHYVIQPQYLNKPVAGADAANASVYSDLLFTWSNTPSFNFAVMRKSTADTLFNTAGSVLVYENQFIEFVTQMPEEYNLAGLGERIHGLRLGNNSTFTIYAADNPEPPDANVYGSHPFYLDTRYYEVDDAGNMGLIGNQNTAEATTKYAAYHHGVYLRNIHGQEILLRPTNITWRAIGGSVDLYFFAGPTQAEVTQQYQEVIGYPAMQQYFTLGYHQCRWGYSGWKELQGVVDNFRKFGIPLETIWSDIDYMNQYRDFDNDRHGYGYEEAAVFLSRLHDNGQHYVPIVDSAIYIPNPANASDAYATYTRGDALDVFMLNSDGSQYIGQVWPGYTVFPDWRSPNTQDWWTSELVNWYKHIEFDGIWIDMNEVSSFCVGSCGTGHLSENPPGHPPFPLPGDVGAVIYDYPEGFEISNTTEAAAASFASQAQASRNAATASELAQRLPVPTTIMRTPVIPNHRSLDYPPYALNNINGPLPSHAVAPSTLHADGTREYDIHNLFGTSILNATYHALLALPLTTQHTKQKRPFIIGRSTSPGSGSLAGHWGGDNFSKWSYMSHSIPQALSFSLFAIPLFGVDACGFAGNTDMELCARWMQLAAFFPFYRNHNAIGTASQEPYVWAQVAEASRTAMAIRYKLLPYMYTLMWRAHIKGDTVMRALAWEFPTDGPALVGADRQFLLGDAVLVSPVLEPNMSTVDAVFPGWSERTRWYDWYTGALANSIGSSQNVSLQAPLGHIPVFVRGGRVLALQAPGYTTKESREGAWSLLVALEEEGGAKGELYLDDGESLVQDATRLVEFAVVGDRNAGRLRVSSSGAYEERNVLANVTVLGVPRKPCEVLFDGMDVLQDGKGVDVLYNTTSRVLHITGLEHFAPAGAWSADWSLSWKSDGC